MPYCCGHLYNDLSFLLNEGWNTTLSHQLTGNIYKHI